MWDELFQLFEEERVLVVQAAGNESYLAVIDAMKRTEPPSSLGRRVREVTWRSLAILESKWMSTLRVI